MKSATRNLSATLLAGFCSASVLAGGPGGTLCEFKQPWPGTEPSYASVVNTCAGDRSFGRIAMDDWACDNPGPVSGVKWWGTTNALADKPQKWFYIAMRGNSTQGNCLPAVTVDGTLPPPVQSWCVEAASHPVTTDCNSQQVYEFTTCLIPPFNPTPGTTYWLQISEIDNGDAALGMDSETINAVDFRWSGYTPQFMCQAVQFLPSNAIIRPLSYVAPIECIGPHDLAFELYRDMTCGKVPPGSPDAFCPWCKPWSISTVDMFLGGESTKSFVANENGFFAVRLNLRPGMYSLTFDGPSSIPFTLPGLFIGPGAIDVGPLPMRSGDADRNSKVNFADITDVLSNFGAGGP